MKSFFYKEVVDPDVVKRNYILKKIAFLKKNYPRDNKELIRDLRHQLKFTEGQIRYYRNNKGRKTLMGDHTTPKKEFLVFKDHRYLADNSHNKPNKKPYVLNKSRYIDSIDMTIRYPTLGGVMAEAGVFKREFRNVIHRKVSRPKYPRTDDPYVGIELEYASSLMMPEVADLIGTHKLQDRVRVMGDSSIRTNIVYPNQIEFCILTKYSDINETLQRLEPIIFSKPQFFSPNSSCGLHVHLDVRNDDPVRVYKNLVCMQGVLFSLASDARKENSYCVPVLDPDFSKGNPGDHYAAISKSSYIKHKTIEVRIHHSTLSLTTILNWVTLLKKIADYKGGDLGMSSLRDEHVLLRDKIKLEPELLNFCGVRDEPAIQE